jgi:hypothetical protein
MTRIDVLRCIVAATMCVTLSASSCLSDEEKKNEPCGEYVEHIQWWTGDSIRSASWSLADTSAWAVYETDVEGICKENHLNLYYEIQVRDTAAARTMRFEAKAYWGLYRSIRSFDWLYADKLYAEDFGLGIKQQSPADSAGWIAMQVKISFQSRGNAADNVDFVEQAIKSIDIGCRYYKWKPKAAGQEPNSIVRGAPRDGKGREPQHRSGELRIVSSGSMVRPYPLLWQ